MSAAASGEEALTLVPQSVPDLIFLDLRDRWGLTQVVANPEVAAAAHEMTSRVRNEFVGFQIVLSGQSSNVNVQLQFQSPDAVPVERGDLRPADLVFFGRDPDDITHVGLYLGDGRFINAEDVERRRRVAFLGVEVARNLFGNSPATGPKRARNCSGVSPRLAELLLAACTTVSRITPILI